MTFRSRETHLVELVDAAGYAIGTTTVDQAHRPPGQLHRAFSVLLVDPGGRLLLQQRAAVKSRFALRWANTCCGHPAPGEPVGTAAGRRLTEELGISAIKLQEIGVYLYQADDPDSGRVEFEYDHVLVGAWSPAGAVTADPSEVAALDWVPPDLLTSELARFPERYAPWLPGVLDVWRSSALPEDLDAWRSSAR